MIIFNDDWLTPLFPVRTQVAIITDGHESFVQFVYPAPIQWVQTFSGLAEVGLPDAKAQAGFSAADGRIHLLRGSGSDQIHNLDRYVPPPRSSEIARRVWPSTAKTLSAEIPFYF